VLENTIFKDFHVFVSWVIDLASFHDISTGFCSGMVFKKKKKLFIVCKLLIYGLTMRAMLDNIMTKNDQDYLINNAIFSG
jgi:hypothetical protein